MWIAELPQSVMGEPTVELGDQHLKQEGSTEWEM